MAVFVEDVLKLNQSTFGCMLTKHCLSCMYMCAPNLARICLIFMHGPCHARYHDGWVRPLGYRSGTRTRLALSVCLRRGLWPCFVCLSCHAWAGWGVVCCPARPLLSVSVCVCPPPSPSEFMYPRSHRRPSLLLVNCLWRSFIHAVASAAASLAASVHANWRCGNGGGGAE